MSRRKRGFTLVEMLVVIFIGSIVITMLGGVFIRAALSTRKEVSRATRTISARHIMERMVRDVQSAYAFPADQSGRVLFTGENHVFPGGHADKLTLIRPKLNEVYPVSLERVVYEVRQEEEEEEEQGGQIIYSSRQPFGGAGQTREIALGFSEPNTIMRLNLMYQARQGGQWEESWDGVRGLPNAVKIMLRISDKQNPGAVRFETTVQMPGRQGALAAADAGVSGATP